MANRAVFGGGALVGAVTAVVFNRFLTQEKNPEQFCLDHPHVEYQEKVDRSKFLRSTEILKYGAPQRSPDANFYTNHVLCYDQAKKTPTWVAEHLTKQNLKGPGNRKHAKFKSDPAVPDMFSAKNSDYWKSGWSRGHMAPAADAKVTQEAMAETFFLTNIVPQNYENNAGFWNRLEMYCRDQLTNKFSNVYVVSGPLMLPSIQEDGKTYVKYEVIGADKVAVPTHLYKIIIADDANNNTPPLMGAFIVPNIPITFDHDLPEYQVPLETLEESTGLKFVPKLDRAKTKNLCEEEGCKLITKVEFDLYVMNRRLAGANTLEKLDKVWKEMEQKNIKPDKYSYSTYENKTNELREKDVKAEDGK